MKWIPKYQKTGKLNFKTTGLPWQQSKQDQEITRNTQSRGGIHGINRFGKDFGFIQNGTRQLTMKGTKEPINIPIFQKPLSSSLK